MYTFCLKGAEATCMEIASEMKKCFILKKKKNAQFQCSLKFLAHIILFWQHYLGNKKPTFLACYSEHVYANILESSKNNNLFQNCQIYSC